MLLDNGVFHVAPDEQRFRLPQIVFTVVQMAFRPSWGHLSQQLVGMAMGVMWWQLGTSLLQCDIQSS